MEEKYCLTCFGVEFSFDEDDPKVVVETVMSHFNGLQMLKLFERIIGSNPETIARIPSGLIRMKFPAYNETSCVFNIDLIDCAVTVDNGTYGPECYESAVMTCMMLIIEGYFLDAKKRDGLKVN